MIEAVYYDGHSSRAYQVVFSVSDGAAYVIGDGISRSVALAHLKVSEPMGAAPRLVTFPDGAFCEVRQHDAFKELLAQHGHHDRAVVRWQFSFWRVYSALLLTVALLVSGYLWGLPWLARTTAHTLPEELVQQIGSVSLENLDKHLFLSSKLPPARQEAIRQRFAQLVLPETDSGRTTARLHFRRGGWIGANALALPSGDIVVTDELVALADRDEQILGVLAHEMGHVRHRHGLQMLLQSSAVGLMAAWLVGDVSSLLATVPTVLAQLAYSRQLEGEADDYAIATLKSNHISPAYLADMMEHLAHARTRRTGSEECRNPGSDSKQTPATRQETAKPDSAYNKEDCPTYTLPAYLSSHPAPEERIAKLRQAAEQM